jgi:hypothetical protein
MLDILRRTIEGRGFKHIALTSQALTLWQLYVLTLRKIFERCPIILDIVLIVTGPPVVVLQFREIDPLQQVVLLHMVISDLGT